MSDTVCTIPKKKKKITAVNTFILLGFSDYVLLTLEIKKEPNNQEKKIADTIRRKTNSAHLTYKLMIPAREFIHIK